MARAAQGRLHEGEHERLRRRHDYDRKRDVLWLLDKAVINVAADKKTDDPGAKINAARSATRAATTTCVSSDDERRPRRPISADTAMAYLTDDGKAIKSLELRGNSRIAMAKPAEGGLQAMGSRDMNINFADDGETIQHSVLVGGSAIQMAGAQGKPGRRISGEVVDVTLGEDSAVTGLRRQHVQLRFLRTARTQRTIRSRRWKEGEPGKGLTGATFRQRVQFRKHESPTPAPAR